MQQNAGQMALIQMRKKINVGQVIERGLDIMAEVSLGRGVLVRVYCVVTLEIRTGVICA